MTDPPPPSIPPIDPATWRESVLSTRSLSYLSQADLLNSPLQSRHPSLAHLYQPPTRRSTLDSTSDYGLEMAPAGTVPPHHMSPVPELPESVAHSLLFTLPREIRDKIWTLCLTTPASTPLDWPSQTPPSDNPASPSLIAPALLRTCRPISHESLPILYTSTPLAFSHPSDANIFTHCIGSPHHTPLLTTVVLNIRTQDTRLWMPYLTSTDPIRSLRADFPNLRDLTIKYKSAKWQHALPVETNLRHWSEDSRLDELIQGAGETYLSGTKAQRSGIRAELSRQAGLPAPTAVDSATGPRIRVLVVCRVHAAHFAALTNPSPSIPSNTISTTHLIPAPASTPGLPAVEAMREGEAFRGFSALDFAGRAVPLSEQRVEGKGGQAMVARSVWARRGGLEIALEVFHA